MSDVGKDIRHGYHGLHRLFFSDRIKMNISGKAPDWLIAALPLSLFVSLFLNLIISKHLTDSQSRPNTRILVIREIRV